MNYLSRQFASAQAEEDFRRFCGAAGHSSIQLPVDPAYVVEVLWDTAVIYLDEGELPGEAIAFADVKTNRIVVEMCGYEPRERFSLAHEVGHVSLHRYLIDLGEWEEKYEIFHEFQADTYASTLLMPELAVANVVAGMSGLLEDDAYKVNLISEKFHVSKPAARIRLEGLNLISNPNIGRDITTYERTTQDSRDTWFTEQ